MKLQHRTNSDYVTSGGGRSIPVTSTTDAIKFICLLINLLGVYVKSLDVDYFLRCQAHSNNIDEMV